MSLWSIGIAFNIAGSCLVAVFGALVLVVRPRTRRSILVGLYGVLFGLSTGMFGLGSALWDLERWPSAVGWVAASLVGLFLGVVVAMWRHLPSRRPGWLRLVAPVLMMAAAGVAASPTLFEPATNFAAGGMGARMYAFVVSLASGAACGLAFIMAQGLAAKDTTAEEWRNDGILASALMLWPASMLRFSLSGDPALARFAWVMAACALLVAAAWLRAGHLAGRPRPARAVAWVVLGAGLLGLLDSVPGAGYTAGIGSNGISRIVAVALLSYAIVRHHVLGLDVKVRFAIKTSTVAAVFLAVLFIVANIAQNYLGGQYGVVVGGSAAGMLFFVMAPIQRAAEKLAQKAVPLATQQPDAGRPGTSKQEGAYRRAVGLALRDRRLTQDEEVHLFHVAEALGIPAGRAMELRHEVEATKGAA